ncbi:hypothetical protein AX15_004305 [Amanita polypyramis BW_CC]|nr:hypothetical protein AX15_004305 [Amanita polypyramis BW_CC]
MVTVMDHVLLHAPSVPKKAALLSWAPLAPPHPSALTFVEVAASSAPAPSVPKSAHLCKVCTKQGTKATVALLRPLAAGPPSNASAIHNFVATRPLSDCLPLSQAITLHGDWALTFKEPLTLLELQHLRDTVNTFHHPGSEVVNHPTSASIKFPHMPMVRPDGSSVSDEDLLNALRSHPRWHDVSFVSNPCFIRPSGHSGDLSALVHCEVCNSHASSTAHSLLKSTVNFFRTYRHAQAWLVN